MVIRRRLYFYLSSWTIGLMIVANSLTAQPLKAEGSTPAPVENNSSLTRLAQLPPDVEPPSEPIPPEIEPPSTAPPPEPEIPTLPPPEELLPPPTITPETPEPIPGVVPETITVERFNVVGSTIFSQEEFDQLLEPFTNRPLTFAELFQARSAVTQYYNDRGFITSGALIPPQELKEGVVTIQVVEGVLEEINVTGTERLKPGYVRNRLEIATEKPLNVNRLLDSLQLLQLDPLIENISAELSASPRPGLSILDVEISEADSFSAQLSADNGRSPSVGSFRRRIQLTEANLLGFGDGLDFRYTNTDGSNEFDVSYTLPVNPRNGTLQLAYGTTSSNVIEPPFDEIDIESESRYYELSFRQPIVRTPNEEFALGITASRTESESSVLDMPFQLSPGADEKGRTRISAVRFFQEWTKRSEREVIAARSQFSLGVDAFEATNNDDAPDSRFFAWRGQAQWVRLLAEDTLLLLRTDVQLADQALVPLEQIGLGGFENIRGYRQDFLLTDNGVIASAELRLPILRVSEWDGVLQLTPFVDFGTGWNNSRNSGERSEPDDNTLASVGLGLRWQQGDNFTARIEWGIPLVSVESSDRTLQEDGIYFSIIYSPF